MVEGQEFRQFGMLQCGNRYGSCGATAGSDDKPQGAWQCPLKRKRLLVGKGKFTVSFDGAALYGAALIVIISVKFQILAVSRRA